MSLAFHEGVAIDEPAANYFFTPAEAVVKDSGSVSNQACWGLAMYHIQLVPYKLLKGILELKPFGMLLANERDCEGVSNMIVQSDR